MEDFLNRSQVAELKELLSTNTAAAAEKIKEHLKRKNNIPLNIAITGESGSGKSSFVNAFRGLTNSDEGAAPTGSVETTTKVTDYHHPRYPSVTLWDLPGVGTMKFPADKYLQLVGFERFDFFIIISANRFRENDVQLAREIKKMGKKFYFIRSKIDNDLYNEERSQRNFNKENFLKQIRDNCIEGLQNEGFQSPQVFLMSSFDLHLYDFSLLHQTLERDLPEHQKHALLLAMPNISLEVIQRKKEAFKANIKYYALASGAGAAVPGLSIAFDVGLIVTAVREYVAGFGLDVPSLKRLADNMGVPFEDLKAVMKSPLAAAEITQDLIMNMLSQLSILGVSLVAEELVEEGLSLIPIFGTMAAVTLSYVTTSKVLNHFLDMLADDAQRVFQKALGL